MRTPGWLLGSLLCAMVLAPAAAQNVDLDPLDLPVLPPDHPTRMAIPGKGQLPEPPPQARGGHEITVQPGPPTFFGEVIPVGDDGTLVYVLDYSSSMGVVGERVDFQTTISRWDVVVREARRSVSGLAPTLRFGMVVFGTNGGCGVAVWQPELVRATRDNKASALAWLTQFTDAMVYGGATPTAPAVVQALAFLSEVIVLLTDGQPSPCGLTGYPHISHRERIRQANEHGTRIDVYGVGLPDQYAEEFARGVASDSSGTFVELRGSP